jgi:lipopolysaccharide transport system permease protein
VNAASAQNHEDARDVKEVVYDSDAQLKHPARFASALFADLRRSGWLTGQLLGQGLRAKYRTSQLGYLWLFAPPLAIAAVWIFLHRSGIISLGVTSAPYPVYVVAGLFLWTAFLRMLNSPLQQLHASRHVLSKINFPWEALILAGWCEVLIEFLVYMLVLGGVMLAFGLNPLAPLIASIPASVALLLLGAGAGLMLAPFGLLFEDVPKAIAVITYGLFFLTPVIYPPPTTMPGLLTLELNPIGVLLVTSREVMTATAVSHPQLAIATAGGSLLLFIVSWLVFRISVPHLVSKL